MNDPRETQRDVTLNITSELEAVGFQNAQEIGRGGFGLVYRCGQPALDRSVAVKVLTADLDDENRARFFREQRAMGRLTGHPNIVSILQVGTTASGRPYIVMPYHPQESLEAAIRSHGPLDFAEALRLGVKMAGALETAHRLEILHRDVKPANILLTDYAEPALTDFGIARISGGFETGTGTVTGSPAFTAPEVLRGDPPSLASDIYSLGATLFCAITGHAAFERHSGEQVVAQFLRITTQPVPDLREHGIPDAICAVIERAMASDPTDRPRSAAALGEEIRELQHQLGYPIDDMALQANPQAVKNSKMPADRDAGDSRKPHPRTPSRNANGNLPLELTSFVGRRNELAEVKKLLSTARLVTLTGIGGVGKTRLALRAAAEARRAFADGVWLVELGELRDESLLADVVASALGLRDQSTRPIEDLLVEFVAARRLLLILDNCEQVVDAAAALVETLLRACPGLHVLATSREILDISGEAVLRVPPLTVPDAQRDPSLRGLPSYDAVTLFAERAAAADSTFELTEDNRISVAKICQRLDGLPLPLELAAARLRAMSVDQVLERLTDKYEILSRSGRDVPTRQQTLRLCVDWSYELCSPREQAVWARLSIFAGSFELDAAEQICGKTVESGEFIDTIASLVDKSIVISETLASVVRFRLLETIRDYGREKLHAAEEYEALSVQHCAWYRQLAIDAEADWISPRQVGWISRLGRERPNLRAAMEFSLSDAGDPDVGLSIATALFMFWSSGGLFNEGRYWLGRILAHQTGEPTAERVKALYANSVLAEVQGDLSASHALVEEGQAMADELTDPMARALIAHAEGLLALFNEDLDRACLFLEQAVAVFGDQVELALQVGATYTLGWAHEMRGDTHRAIECYERVLATTKSHGESVYRSYALWALGVAVWRQGDNARATMVLEESLQIAHRVDDPLTAATCLETLAWIACSNHDPSRAATLMAAAEALVQSVGSSTVIFPNLSHHHDHCERAVRRALGERTFNSALRKGGNLDFAASVAYALGQRPPRHDSTTPVATLTKREQQVAELVAEGMTNRAIAEKLVISQRTAQGHVEHVLAKLGFTSRAQIAAWVVEQAQ